MIYDYPGFWTWSETEDTLTFSNESMNHTYRKNFIAERITGTFFLDKMPYTSFLVKLKSGAIIFYHQPYSIKENVFYEGTVISSILNNAEED